MPQPPGGDAGVGTLPRWLLPAPEGCRLRIKLIPRASRNEVGDPRGDHLVVRVTAPPVDEAANQALRRFMAERIDCAPGRIELERGQHSRQKVLLLRGLDAGWVVARLGLATQEPRG
ncbi:DUF167 domain-containing protein [Limisphaera sp. 4302-co]